jgi:transcriptional regulator with XRE-family HTH domain
MPIKKDHKKRLNSATLPLPVRRALLKLGKGIRDARIRRRIPTSVMADRALINRMTLYKIERGNASVSVAAYATVLFVLGLLDSFAEIADPKFDEVGLSLEEERLPKRIRFKSPVSHPKPQGTRENR